MKSYSFGFFISLLFSFIQVNSINTFAKTNPHTKNKSTKSSHHKHKKIKPAEEMEAYIAIEDDEIISAFDQPGKNWKTCVKPACEAVAWPDNKSKIILLGEEKLQPAIDPLNNELIVNTDTGEVIFDKFIKVQIEYERDIHSAEYHKEHPLEPQMTKITKVGWIDADFVKMRSKTTQPEVSLYDDTEISIKVPIEDNRRYHEGMISKDCTPKILDPKTCGIEHLPKIIEKATESRKTNKSIKSQADAILNAVGKCIKKEDIKINVAESLSGKSKLNYDLFVLPNIEKVPVPKVKNENNEPMTRADLINIDAVARTLYSEVSSCFKKGLENPMAVARVMLNRAEKKSRRNQFINADHAQGKPDLAKAATKPSQFNVWSNYIDYKPNPTLDTALCPIKNKYIEAKQSNRPVPQEVSNWRNAVRIATEAVLHPKNFKERTKNITMTEYTSYLDNHLRMKRKFPTIEGRRIDRNGCVELWE